MNGLNPGQMVIKIVNEELVALMGSETTEIRLEPGKATTVIMMQVCREPVRRLPRKARRKVQVKGEKAAFSCL